MKSLLSLFLLLCFISCEQEPDLPPRPLSYEITIESGNGYTYDVQYLHSDGSDYLVGTFSNDYWSSGSIYDFDNGDLVRLRVDNKSGSATYRLRVFFNNVLVDEKTTFLNAGSSTLEQYIPIF